MMVINIIIFIMRMMTMKMLIHDDKSGTCQRIWHNWEWYNHRNGSGYIPRRLLQVTIYDLEDGQLLLLWWCLLLLLLLLVLLFLLLLLMLLLSGYIPRRLLLGNNLYNGIHNVLHFEDISFVVPRCQICDLKCFNLLIFPDSLSLLKYSFPTLSLWNPMTVTRKSGKAMLPGNGMPFK